jgi:hypothetical protein
MREGDFVAFARKDNGVLVKPKRMDNPDDVLNPEESALVKKAEREIRQGRFVTLAQLRMTWTIHVHDAAAKQLEAVPPDRRKRSWMTSPRSRRTLSAAS